MDARGSNGKDTTNHMANMNDLIDQIRNDCEVLWQQFQVDQDSNKPLVALQPDREGGSAHNRSEIQQTIEYGQIKNEGMRNSYKFETKDDILESFSNIQQDSTMGEYLLRFDELKTSILANENWNLSEEFLIYKFINGLKHDVKNFMKAFCPYISLSQAIDVARLHERYLGKKNTENGDEDVVDQLKKLVQTGNVDEYETKFKNLKSLVFAANRGLSESYFISCFISGLKPRIAHLVKMYKPQSLSDAISLARLQEMWCLVEEDANNNSKTFAIVENMRKQSKIVENVEKQSEIQADLHALDEKPVNKDLLLRDLEVKVDYDNVCDSLFELEKMNFMRQPSPIQNSSEMVQVETLAPVIVNFLPSALDLEFSTVKLQVVQAVAILGGITASSCRGKTLDGVFVGAFPSMSSTSMMLKFLLERNGTSVLHGQVIIGTMILQDCVVCLLCDLPLVLGSTIGLLQGVISISLTNESYRLDSSAICLLVAWDSEKFSLSLELEPSVVRYELNTLMTRFLLTCDDGLGIRWLKKGVG